jgi:hypothetical protein
MNNKIQSYKAAVFHAANIPAKWKYLWDEFVCCQTDKTVSFEDVAIDPSAGSFVPNHFVRVLDYLFVFGNAGIMYIDYDTGTATPTTKLSGEFTWAAMCGDRIWFGGDPGTGFWYSLLSDPFTIIQSNIATGTAYGIGVMGMPGFYPTPAALGTAFLSSNGGYYFDPDDELLKPHTYVTQDFKYLNWYAYGGTGDNSGLWMFTGSSFSQISAYNITGNVMDEQGNYIFFAPDRILRVIRGATTASTLLSIVAYKGELDRSYRLVLAGATGLYTKTGSLNLSMGYKWATLGTDGYLYLCGANGTIYYWDEYNETVVGTGKSGGYKECSVGADGRLYFAGADIVRMIPTPAGNTGYAVARKLNLHRIKYGEAVVETRDMLNAVQPEITVAELKRLSQAAVEQRAADVWQSAPPAKAGLTPENSFYENNPTMCEIGESGFASKMLIGDFKVIYSANLGPSAYKYGSSTFDIGHVAHTWSNVSIFITVLYIDNISAWTSGRNTIKLQGSKAPNIGSAFWRAPTIGFIEYPPEEWVLGNTSPSYNAVRQRIAVAPHKVTYPSSATEWDISSIYEGPNAKTLVIYTPEITTVWNGYKNVYLQNGRIMVNGEILHIRLYKLVLLEWSDRVNGIAKTLTATVAVANTATTYSILDAFDSYAAITEPTYLSLSVAEINARANALMTYAAEQQGQTKYNKLNEVIS